MHPVIEHAQPSDGHAIYALLQANHLPLAGLTDHIATALVARVDGAVVGSVALEVYTRSALLRSVAVTTAWRGQGLGEQLVRAALRLAREQKISHVYLLTETAQDFFSRLGFHSVERGQVASDVQQSVEFTSACPLSAAVMVVELQP